jgi:hypothetical protein
MVVYGFVVGARDDALAVWGETDRSDALDVAIEWLSHPLPNPTNSLLPGRDDTCSTSGWGTTV